MYDTELVKEILRQILWSAQTIAKRFAPITSPEDFVASESGLEKLDAICMQLIAIGESVKHLDEVTAGGLLLRYPQIEWKRVMGMRDVLSHHYFDLDAEVVYAVCDTHIEELADAPTYACGLGRKLISLPSKQLQPTGRGCSALNKPVCADFATTDKESPNGRTKGVPEFKLSQNPRCTHLPCLERIVVGRVGLGLAGSTL